MEKERWLAGEFIQVTDRVEANLERPWTLSGMAEVAGYSPFHFHRAFRDEVGETPTAFLERLRLERAALLLLASDTPITHLAWDVGFRNPETFARRFRNRFGVAARAYRRHQIELWSRLGFEAGVDPLVGPGKIDVDRLPAIKAEVRRRIGDEEAFDLGAGGVGLTLDWAGVTEPGRVRQDEGVVVGNGAGGGNGSGGSDDASLRLRDETERDSVVRVIGDGTYATLAVPAAEPVSVTTYQRLFVWAMAGRYRLRPGAILEIQRGDEISVHLPVRDAEEG